MPKSSVFPIHIRAEYQDVNQAFSQFRADAEFAGKSIKQQFERDGREISSIVKNALTLPRNQAGALNLGSDELKTAAREASVYASGLEEVERAARQLARETNDTTEHTRRYLQAVNATTREARQNAKSLNIQATTYERLQGQLNQTKSATDRLAASQKVGAATSRLATNSSRAQRFAMIQVGQQFQDVAIQLQTNTRLATIFVQQGSQLAFAVSGMGGKLGNMARILAGPWGAAVFGGVTALSLFAKSNEGTTKATEKTSDALDFQKRSIFQLKDAIQELREESERANRTTFESEIRARNLAITNIRVAISEREIVKARLEKALQGEKLALRLEKTVGGAATVGAAEASKSVSLAQKEIEAINASLEDLGATLRNSEIPVLQREIAASTDDALSAQLRFDKSLTKLNKTFGEGAINSDKYTKERGRLEAQLKSEQATARESSKSGSKKLPSVTLSEVTGILKRELGAVIGSTTRTKAQNDAVDGAKNSFHLLGQGIDLPFSKGNNRNITKEQIRDALGQYGISIEELLSTGDKDHDDHTHVGFSTRRQSGEQVAKAQIAREAKDTSRLARVSDQSAAAIGRINDQFDDQPRLVDRSVAAVRKLDDIISELGREENKNTPRLAELIQEAQEARFLASNAVGTELSRIVEDGEQNIIIQKLLLEGREQEAEIVERIARAQERLGIDDRIASLEVELDIARENLELTEEGSLVRAAQEAIIKSITSDLEKNVELQNELVSSTVSQVVAEEEVNEKIKIRQEQISRQVSAVSSLRGELESLFSGDGQDFFKNIKDTFSNLRSQTLVESIFGDSLRELEDLVRKESPIGKAEDRLTKSMETTGDESINLGNKFIETAQLLDTAQSVIAQSQGTTDQVSSIPGLKASNDNSAVLPNGTKATIDVSAVSLNQLSKEIGVSLTAPLLDRLDGLLGTKFFSNMSQVFSGALQGYLRAGAVGGVLGGLEGLTEKLTAGGFFSDKLGGDIGSALGTALGGAETGAQTSDLLNSLGIKSNKTGASLGGAAGALSGVPGLELAGSILGGLVGGLFKKSPAGSAVINSVTGDARISANKSAVTENLGGLSSSVQSSLSDIAERFDASIGDFSVSIGQWEGFFRVSASGSSLAGDKRFPDRNPGDIVYDGEDPEAAVRAALSNAIADGAIQGIRDTTQRILQSGKELEVALQEALDFESIFDRLDQRKDPLGFELKQLNEEFSDLLDIAREYGATVEEIAALEELYGLERADIIKSSTEQFVRRQII